MQVKTVQNIMQGFGLVDELPSVYELQDDRTYLIKVEEDVDQTQLERLAQHLVARGAPNFVIMAGNKAAVLSKEFVRSQGES